MLAHYLADREPELADEVAWDEVALREHALLPDDALAEEGGSVSAGQRERLALARVLAALEADPHQTVLLDEPTAHLDPATEARVLALLRTAADRGAGASVNEVLVMQCSPRRDGCPRRFYRLPGAPARRGAG